MRHTDLTRYVTPLRGHTLEVAKLFPLRYADLIYIDADHTEESCYNDLVAYWPLLRPGGVLLGDDYHEIPSVKAAVTRFCAERGLTAIDCNDKYHYKINK